MAISLKELKRTNTISMSDIKNTINSYQKKEDTQPSVSTNVLSTPYENTNKKNIPTNYLLPTNTLKKDTIQKNYDINTIRNANGLSSVDVDENTFNLKEWRENNPDKIRVETRTKEEQMKDQALGFVTTPLNILVETGKGVVDYAEGVGDAMLQLGSSKVNPYYWFNPDKLKSHQQTAAELISKDSSQNFIDNTLGYSDVLSTGKTIQETIDENSLVKSDNTLGQVFRSTGSQLPSMMIGGAGTGKAGTIASNISFATNTYGNAIGEAYEKGADRNTANLYGVTQATIELATEKLYGGLGSALKTGAIDDVLAKKVSEKLGDTLMSKLTQMGIGAVAEGGEEVASELLNQAVKKLSELNGGQLQQLIEDPNYLDSFVNGVLGSLVISGTQLATNSNPNNVGQINSNKNLSNNSIILNENQQNNTNIQNNEISAENSSKYNFLPTNNDKSNNLRQSASNYFNNSQETINMINTMDKVVRDKGYNVLFDNTIVNSRGELVNAQIKTLDNGEMEIRINPNSERAGEFLLTHEITHAIETDSMKQLVMDYASKNAGFNEALESLKQTYDVEDVTDEVLADISGQLFGNQEFINNLSMEQPSIFRKIYNKIVELANKITGNSKESLFIRDLKNKWETAYRNTSTEQAVANLNNETKFSTIGLKGAKNLAKNSDSRYYKNILNNQLNAVGIFNNSNENLETTNKKSKRETGWFKTKYGDWGILISDKNSKLLQRLEPNKTYKLGDIFEHELLYKAYPELQNLKVKTADIETTGGYASIPLLPANTITNEIYIRNSDLNKKDFRKTLLHEINHYIEHKENYDKRSRGSNSKIAGVEDYRNNLGEIISNETKINADLTQEELDVIILPEQAKENPQYKNIREKLLESNRNDLLKNGDDNNALQDLELPIQNKIKNNKVVNKKDNNSSRIINDMEELDNSSFSLKQKQLEIIKNNNPVEDDYHTWIRNIDDIKTFEETLEDEDYKEYYEAGEDFDETYSADTAKEALETGKITVYSSYPIEQGIFVSPSRMEAESYSGDGKVYSKEVDLTDVAWIDPTQGQYAKVYNTKYSLSQDNQGRTLTKEQQEYFKDSKVRDEEGRLLEVYHGTDSGGFTVFEAKESKNGEKNIEGGFWFTKNKELAKDYSGNKETSKVYSSYLNIKNPYIIDANNQNWYNINGKTTRQIALEAKEKGYDGVIYKNVIDPFESTDVYVVFNSNQIKNVDNTNPTSDEDIRYSQQDNKWQEHLEKNYKATGTRTDMAKLSLPKASEIENINKVENTPKLPTAKKDIPQDPTKESSYDNDTKKTRKQVSFELLNEMGISEQDIAKGNDIISIDLSRTDPIRVNEKIFGAEIGQKINDATINKTKHNEAERTRWLNKERNEIKELGIKAQSKESAAVQKYGEKQYITRNNEVIPYGDNELAKEFPDIETQNKIKKAAQIIRNKYDNYIEQINEVLVDMGYNPIKKRPDYMRHFQALNDVFSRFGTPLNAESMQNDSLPTDINGLTDQFKPGKQYFANAMQRMGLKTEYDAITGIDGYLEGASNLIFHTEDIQRYRALSKFVRDTYGSKNGYEDFADMTVKEQEQRIADIQSNKLAKYAAWLDEQANALAGKKGKIDRGAEELFGRKVYTVLQTAKKQVGSNMTGFNVRSALTNFASAIQGASKINKLSFLKGTMSTINNIVHKDGLIDKSDFLTNRFGSDSLSPKLWQKMSNAGQIFMKGSDYFTANQVWRSKYFENLSNGMSESEAIRKADDFASRVMGDRSKGSTATIFNSNTLGFLTQFQLEVNNQWSSLIHDNKMDVQRGNKTGASVVFQLGQLFAMSYMFNGIMKSLTGSSVMIDPIELLKKIFNPDDEEKSLEERTTEVLGEVVNNIPFASIFTGGRIPISEAFEGVSTGFKYATGQTDEYGNKYTLSDVKDDVIESAFYWLLPTGYGQIKKTAKGASMYSGKLPTAGSYTDSGNLRFTADESVGGKTKALLFGQYSSKEAQDYIDSGFKTISKNHIQEMKDLGMTSTEYRNYRTGLSNAGTKNSDKLDYINNLDVSIEQKNIMANNVVDSKKYTIDMSNYDDYGSYEAMRYALQYPTNYSIIKSITDYDEYSSYRDKVNEIKEQYEGEEKSTIRKQKVFQYINSLPYSRVEKIILFKMLGNYGISDYKNDVFNYINGLKISKSEKEQMWQQIYGK